MMTDQDIIELFDSSNITLEALAKKAGKSVNYIKRLLMDELGKQS